MGGLRGALLVALGLWLVRHQADGVLASLQGAAGSGGYGVGDLGPASVERVRDVLAAWSQSKAVAHTALGVYFVLDLLFIAAYALVLVRMFKRLGTPDVSAHPMDRAAQHPARWIVALAGADVAENALRLVVALNDGEFRGFIWLSWAATVATWVFLAAVLVLLGWVWRHSSRWSRDTGSALLRLRVPLLLLGPFGLLVVFDPSDQLADTFRRWLDSPGQFAVSASCTLVAVALLGLATWTTTRRSILAAYTDDDKQPSLVRWGGAAVLLGGGAVAGWRNLAGLAAVIVIVLGLELVWWWLTRTANPADRAMDAAHAEDRRRDLAAAPDDARRDELRRLARGLSAWPLVAVLFGIASAMTAPAIVLTALERDTTRAAIAALVGALALVAVAVLAFAVPALLRASEGSAAPGRVELRHVGVVAACVATAVAAVAEPLDVPSVVGPVGMTAVGLALLVAVLGEAQRYGDTHAPTAGLAFAGFRRVPVALLLIVAYSIASVVDDGSYHDVHRNGHEAPDRDGTPLEVAFEDWRERNCAREGGAGRRIPLVLVGGHGGGIRSAYWTASVLTDLAGGPADKHRGCPGASPFDQVFAMAGASGGSVGVITYSGHARAGAPASGGNWYRDAMGDYDFLAVPIAWGLLVDLPRGLVGFDGPDRARRFEDAWERQDPTLRADFFATQQSDTALLMPSGTQVETGCRMNISPLRLTAPTQSPSQGECAAVIERPSAAPDLTPRSPVLPAAALTSDVLDYLCDGSLNRSTAALTSARFPYVSPSGRLQKCAGGRDTAIVDGGYADNTGGQPLLNLWARLEPLVAAHNATGGAPLIVPVFVDIDSFYAKAAKAGPVARTGQLLTPPVTAARADALDDRGVAQQANAEFSVALPGTRDVTCKIGFADTQRYVRIAPSEGPGVQAPLGWTLSKMAMDDLDAQRDKQFDPGTPASTLRAILRGGAVQCGP